MKRKRILQIGYNLSINHFPLISNFIVSFLIVKYHSLSLWGETAYYIIWIQLLTVIINWGSKEYLLREFSVSPSLMNQLWQNNLLSRTFPLLAICLFVFIMFPFSSDLILLSWLLSLFVSRSFDAYIYYQKNFSYSFISESLSLLLTISLIVAGKENLTIYYILTCLMIGGWVKAFTLLIIYRKNILDFSVNKPQLDILKKTFNFFLLSVIGILTSRIDIFCINYFMEKESVGSYQIFLTFLIATQNLGYFLIQPFTKNIYRLNKKSFQKVWAKLIYFSPLIVCITLSLAYTVLIFIYKIEFSLWFGINSFLFCIPAFIYSMILTRLFKLGYEHFLIYILTISICLNVVLNIFTIPLWGLTGVIFSGMLIEWLKLSIFLWMNNKLIVKKEKVIIQTINLP